MGLNKEVWEAMQDGDPDPYDTVERRRGLGKYAPGQDSNPSSDSGVEQADADSGESEFVRKAYAVCENAECPSVGQPQFVTMELTEIAPVSEFQAGRWTCEQCSTENYWANS